MQETAGHKAFFEINSAGQTQIVGPSSNAEQIKRPQIPLSLRLRDEVASIHQAIEIDAGLPSKILNMNDYKNCLMRFFSVVAPLEDALAAMPGWAPAGIDLSQRARTPALAADLAALGLDPASLKQCNVTAFADFPSAFGGLYVLEGSTLGGKFILRDLETRLGPALTGATSFFAGHGANTGPMWQAFKAALDAFGDRNMPWQDQVVAGAVQIFGVFATGLRP